MTKETEITETETENEPLPAFYPPLGALKEKVGGGGLSKETVKRAQMIIENNNTDFIEVAAPYMSVLNDAITNAKNIGYKDHEGMIEHILFPAMQLKANGEIFHYPIITIIGERMLRFLEKIDKINSQSIEIIDAFEESINLIFQMKLKGSITMDGQNIISELDAVCERYFEKYPDNIHPRFLGKQKNK